MKLSCSEKKKLKTERRIGYVFMAIVYMFGALFNAIYFLINSFGLSLTALVLIDFGVLLLGAVIMILINKQVNRDLKSNTKGVLVKVVKDKHTEKSHEAGGGTLYIPILGGLFPKLWDQKIGEITKYFVVTEGYTYEVDKNEYESFQIGETIQIYYGKASGIILGYSKTDMYYRYNF